MIKTIPLNKLVPSPRNVRRHNDPAADAELKVSIAARGLLQNLIVRPGAKGKFEVEAGERRRKAMLALAYKTCPIPPPASGDDQSYHHSAGLNT